MYETIRIIYVDTTIISKPYLKIVKSNSLTFITRKMLFYPNLYFINRSYKFLHFEERIHNPCIVSIYIIERCSKPVGYKYEKRKF